MLLLEADRDGVLQIADALKNYRGLASIQIISHGAPGAVALGPAVLNAATLDFYRPALRTWGNALQSGGNILFYGCNVAQGEAGDLFINGLAQLTGAAVAASSDATGARGLGGNWVLEKKTGTIRAGMAINSQELSAYRHLLAAPQVDSLDPASGPPAGGTTVTITGMDFVDVTEVTFDGVAAVLQSATSTSIEVLTPAGAGIVDVLVTTPSGTGNAIQFTYLAPVLSSITPASGPPAGGTAVTITGDYFDDATEVTFGGTAVAFTLVSSTSITAVTPAGAGTVDVLVTTPSGTGNAIQYTFLAPVLASITPASGPPAGGTAVTITGNYFDDATEVTFNEVAVAFALVSSTSITAVAPPGAGIVDVLVTTPSGTSNPSWFTNLAPVVLSITPASGPAAGGTAVTIAGNYFNDATTVTLGGTAATFTLVSSTTITTVTPAGSGSADVVVTTPSGIGSGSGLFTYVPPPVLSSIEPSFGLVTGGTAVTVTGGNFTGVTSVTIGAVAAAGFTVVDDTHISTTTPAGAAGAGDVAVTTPYGTAAGAALFTYAAPPGEATAVVATAGNGRATVNFTPPAADGGLAITTYTATSDPDGLTGGCAGPDACLIAVNGLANDTNYSFTVQAANAIGAGLVSVPSNSVTPSRSSFSGLAFSQDSGFSATDFITNGADQTITAVLSAALLETDTVSGSLDNGGTWTDLTTLVTGTALAWTGVTLPASNTLQLKMTDSGAVDGPVASQAFVVDTAQPVATVTGAGSTTAGTPFGATISFDETVTGLALANITVANGTASEPVNVTPGRVWTAQITPTGLPGQQVTTTVVGAGDVAGNGNVTPVPLATLVRPTAGLSPAAIAFSGGDVGVAGENQTATFTNTSAGQVTVGTISIAGTHPADFLVTGGTCTASGTVGASAGCTITIAFTPQAAGSRNADLLVTADDTGSPHTTTLAGITCAQGTFLLPDHSSCQACATGYYQDEWGQRSCKKAPIGTFVSDTGAAAAVPCAAGSAQDLAGQQTCDSCPKGQFQDTPGQALCKDAPVGHYTDTIGATTAVICATGTAQSNPGWISCSPCSPGFYQDIAGQATCKQASLGTYVDGAGASVVVSCPTGSYQDQPGQSSCNSCGSGYYQDLTGQAACKQAQAGTYVASAEQPPAFCAAGTSQPSPGQTQCISCPQGKYQDAIGQVMCVPAPRGYYVNDTGMTAATPCAAGTYQDQTGQTSCTACAAGEYQTETGQAACHVIPKTANSIVFDPSDTQKLYAGIDPDGIFRSADGGAVWTAATTQPTNKRIKAIVLTPGDSTKLYAASYGDGLFASNDSGASWFACANTDLTNLNVITLAMDASGKLYAGTEAGVFTSSTGCATWVAINTGLP